MRNVWESMGSRCESIIGILSGQSSPVFPRFPLLRLFFYSHFFYLLFFTFFTFKIYITLHVRIHPYTPLYCIHSHCIHPHRVHQLQLSSARNVQLSSPRIYLFLCSILYFCLYSLSSFCLYIVFIFHLLYILPRSTYSRHAPPELPLLLFGDGCL